MVSGIDKKAQKFTGAAFRERALEFSLPLEKVKELDGEMAAGRGDHDLNPEFEEWPEPEGGLRSASVLIGVVDRKPEARVILTLRAAHLSAHAGQISFPGGRYEDDDADLIATALRETHEEVGIEPDHVTPIGLLEPYKTRTGYRIMPVLGLISEEMVLRADESEVAEIFEVPLEFLMNAANHQRHSRFWKGRERHFYAMPYGDRYIWGATAGILRIMYERLYAE